MNFRILLPCADRYPYPDWTSMIGYTDNAAHNNMDFLPWFLQQMNAKSKTARKRLLDYLDIHYYYQADTSANDAAAKALRLRATRSLWGEITTCCCICYFNPTELQILHISTSLGPDRMFKTINRTAGRSGSFLV